MPKMICEAGKEISTEHKCPYCGAEPGASSYCRGEKKRTERDDLIEQLTNCRRELARYKEREATIGWADG